jgi:outer membrane protein OmpA-like peptidoglycan-associated protein
MLKSLNTIGSTLGRPARFLLAGGVVLSVLCLGARAETLSQQQIFDALKGAPLTRSLSLAVRPVVNEQDQSFIESLRHRNSRSLSFDERNHAAAIAESNPSIDLEIYFDYNSAAITQRAIPQLDNLGAALTQSGLNGGTFMVGGHTDGKGGDTYNLGLSDRRAESVKRYLTQKFHINSDNLIAIGYGKRELKNKADPLAAENRRVQIAKMEAQAQR